MSARPIKVGDVVMVVRPAPCCGAADSLGRIFTVMRLNQGKTTCEACRCDLGILEVAYDDGTWYHGQQVGYRFSRLKRLDPDNLKAELLEDGLVRDKLLSDEPGGAKERLRREWNERYHDLLKKAAV